MDLSAGADGGTMGSTQMPLFPRLADQEQAQASSRHFASSRKSRQPTNLRLVSDTHRLVELAPSPLPPILSRLRTGRFFGTSPAGDVVLRDILESNQGPRRVAQEPAVAGMSAGKNTYTYDAHTYHTKVPPQGIAELLSYYLPEGGVVLDPFAGSGMTGVASRVLGLDSVLSELSPAACFIADRFTRSIDPYLYDQGVQSILSATADLRNSLYTTQCRECGKDTEIIYTVWSYRVRCPHCADVFVLWDHCRSYGKRVKDHKILTEFPCPNCRRALKKSRLERLDAVPVILGYKCCGSRQQEVTHPLESADRALIEMIEAHPPVADGFYPTLELPDGVNLRQPKKHGLDRIDRMYTGRNLAAASQIWRSIHRVDDPELAGFLAFTFTSLYRRITRMSEFRFWGGSGNTANFNVPFIFDEPNVFLAFTRKARTIRDHLETTAERYRGRCVVLNESATSLQHLPSKSVDLVFTDPPFGSNINYSEMNVLWESWLEAFTSPAEEAIVNRVQGKGLEEYQMLMTNSLRECCRVLRDDGWLLLVFMNSSGAVWERLRAAVVNAGFEIRKTDIFDKRHGTFKQFVSDNTAGCDLVLHCTKSVTSGSRHEVRREDQSLTKSIENYLRRLDFELPQVEYLHVARGDEVDFRRLYSDWLAEQLAAGLPAVDFSYFRSVVVRVIIDHSEKEAEST